MPDDYYSILGISHDALPEEIRRAYHRLAKMYHPDIYKGYGGDRKFKLLNEAYRTLIDPDQRRRYDFKLTYGSSLKVRTRADQDRARRPYINEEMFRRSREQGRRENEILRRRFRWFDKFIFWSLLTLAATGLIWGIADMILNMRFAGMLASAIIIIMLFAIYNRARKG